MRLLVLSVLCCFYAAVQGEVGNADAYLDKVLDNVRNHPFIRSKIDPLVIDDVPFDGGRATNIRVDGLINFGRKGPATFGINGTRLVLEANVGLDNVYLNTRYRYKANRMMKFSGEVGAKIDSVHCYIKLTIEGVRANLESIQVPNLSGLKVTRFTGASIVFNWLAKWIVNIVIAKRRDKIRSLIETESRQAIQDALEKVNISNFLN